MDKLDTYLAQAGMTAAAFAAKLEVSAATISRLRKGKQTPSWELLRKIAIETNGAVSPNDFLDSEPAPTPSEVAA